MITQVDTQDGPTARNRLAQARPATLDGARAALESFYYAFNHRDPAVLAQVWLADPLVQLNNPLGGILRGSDQIARLYQRIFDSPASVQVTLGDIVEFEGAEVVVFAGQETGQFTDPAGRAIPLRIRTTRVFAYDRTAQRWGQVHHHGSIDDPDALRDYQDAVAAASYQGESRILDSPEGVCAGQEGSEYPATSVRFSNFKTPQPGPWQRR